MSSSEAVAVHLRGVTTWKMSCRCGGEQRRIIGIAGHVDARSVAERKNVAQVIKIGVVGGKRAGVAERGSDEPAAGGAALQVRIDLAAPLRVEAPFRVLEQLVLGRVMQAR